MTIYAYQRVSTTEQGESGLGLQAQADAIAHWAGERQFTTISEVSSGKGNAQPRLRELLEMLQPGDTLVVSKLDRLGRSVAQFAVLLEKAVKQGFHVVAIDFGLDMQTPGGELMANVMMSFAQYERRIISQRTKEALANVDMRKPERAAPPQAVTRALELRTQGKSLRAIATTLTLEGYKPGQGGQAFYHTTIRSMLTRHHRDTRTSHNTRSRAAPSAT